MSEPTAPPGKNAAALRKIHSWSPGPAYETTWCRRRRCHCRRRRHRCRTVTDDDVEELQACFELGFGFDSPDLDPKLADTFPALEIYHSNNKPPGRGLFVSSEVGPADGGATTVLDLGDDPTVVKDRLKEWSQMVAWDVQYQILKSKLSHLQIN